MQTSSNSQSSSSSATTKSSNLIAENVGGGGGQQKQNVDNCELENTEQFEGQIENSVRLLLNHVLERCNLVNEEEEEERNGENVQRGGEEVSSQVSGTPHCSSSAHSSLIGNVDEMEEEEEDGRGGEEEDQIGEDNENMSAVQRKRARSLGGGNERAEGLTTEKKKKKNLGVVEGEGGRPAPTASAPPAIVFVVEAQKMGKLKKGRREGGDENVSKKQQREDEENVVEIIYLNEDEENVGGKGNGEEERRGGGVEGEEEEDVDDQPVLEGCEHSICPIDPVTKKRFYEPHKRPGCSDIYCLSRVTQIGERICNIENKMIQLGELFEELVKNNKNNKNFSSTDHEERLWAQLQKNNHQISLPLFSQQQFVAPPPPQQQYHNQQQQHQNNNHQIIAPPMMGAAAAANFHLPNMQTFPAAASSATIGNYNSNNSGVVGGIQAFPPSNYASSTTRPAFGQLSIASRVPQQRMMLAGHPIPVLNRIIAPSIVTSSSSGNIINAPSFAPPTAAAAAATATISATRPLPPGFSLPPIVQRRGGKQQLTAMEILTAKNPVKVSNQVLPGGVRIYYLEKSKCLSNCCPVCFAIFSEARFPDPETKPLYAKHSHLKRHIAESIESFLCLICNRGGREFRVHFLSLPAIVQHLLNEHEVSRSAHIALFYEKAAANPGTISSLQSFIAKQLHFPLAELQAHNAYFQGSTKKVESKKGSNNKSNKKFGASTSKNESFGSQKLQQKLRGREATPEFDLNGDQLEHLLGSPKPCSLIQRHRMLEKATRPTANKILVPIKSKNLCLNRNTLEMARFFTQLSESLTTTVEKEETANRRNKRASLSSSLQQTHHKAPDSAITSSTSGQQAAQIIETTNTNDGYSSSTSSSSSSKGGLFSSDPNDSDYAPNESSPKKKKRRLVGEEPSTSSSFVSHIVGQQKQVSTGFPTTDWGNAADPNFVGAFSSSQATVKTKSTPTAISKANKNTSSTTLAKTPKSVKTEIISPSCSSTPSSHQPDQPPPITPSSALIKQFGYVASRGIFISKPPQPTATTSANIKIGSRRRRQKL